MDKKCFADGCRREVVFVCTCDRKTTYLCKKHQTKHSLLPSDHMLKSLLVSSPEQQASEYLVKVSKALKYLKILENDLLSQSFKIISNITELTQKTIKNVRDAEKALQLFAEKVYLGKKVNREYFERFQRLVVPQEHLDVREFEGIFKQLNNLYDFNLFKQKEDMALESSCAFFPKDQEDGGLLSIDLNTLKCLPLDYAKMIGAGVQVARIDEESYFLYGGRNPNYNGDIFILNLKNKYCQPYGTSSARGLGAAVYENGKVYIFGGYEDGAAIDMCQIFKISAKEWITISSLPMPLYFSTASISYDMIILSGFQSMTVYAYQNDIFSSILDVTFGATKIVCEGWIVTENILYESQSRKNDQWAAHRVDCTLSYPWMPTSFRRNQFIYFINGDSNTLWRIDTKLKTLNSVEYNSI